ncbi:MAG: Gfo/Idh/MocA family oxidoreductase [Oscillospiraceae bacterium]|nr:Gfo/Idh/MocA family oxidoreductase [Oscillospiraceae bacterium]
MRRLRYGIIGTGGVSGKHLSGYSSIGGEVEICAACDLDEARLKAAAEKYSIPATFTDYRELLGVPGLDFVSVCLPNHLHAPVTVEALRRGISVHCEKPMALNAAEARSMMDARAESGKRLMVGLNNRFTPKSQYIKKYIAKGSLGEVYFAKAGWVRRKGLPREGWFCEREKSGGGAFIDLGVHFVDLVLYFLGYPKVRTVTADTYSKLGRPETYVAYSQLEPDAHPTFKYDVEEMATGYLQCDGGFNMAFEISWASNIERERTFYEIYGTDGGVRYSSDMASEDLAIYTRIGGQLADVVPRISKGGGPNLEFRQFAACVRDGTEPAIAPPEQAVEMMRVIDAVYESSRARRQVVLG